MKSNENNKENLASKNPELIKQWHSHKNGNLTPYDVTHGSNRVVWWQCEKGHIWKGRIAHRANGVGCPYCSGKSASADNCLQTLNPELSIQWHPTKNGNLTPNDVTPGSGKKVWWCCDKKHEWEATINSRVNGRGCPFCSGRYAFGENCLQASSPELAMQWHSIKNGCLTPDNVTSNSNKKVWWSCKKGHEWEATISSRKRGNGCPYCSGLYACDENCLQTLNPELAKQWHSIKNNVISPNDITLDSRKNVWWQCEKGHEWETSVASRAKGTGCPYCAGKRVCDDNSLQTLNPGLSIHWHPSKNDDLTPSNVTAGSRKKVWWKCDKGHEWEATVASRTNGTGCPFCSNQRVCEDNSLKSTNPEIAKQWHPTRNLSLTPDDVVAGSDKKAWWRCEKDHEWKATIRSRKQGSGCPYCSGFFVHSENCLQVLNPELSKQWHPSKNGLLTPSDVTSSSSKRVWWQCEKGHEWETTVNARNSGGRFRGCPHCAQEMQTSFPEQAIHFYLKETFKDTLNRFKHNERWEIDVFIPSLNFGIEYDGIRFHNENKKSDSEKENYIQGEGIHLLRVKETAEKTVNCYRIDNIIFCNKSLSDLQLNEVIKACFEYLSENTTRKFSVADIDIKRDRSKIYDLYVKGEKERSFSVKYTELSKQWHHVKNGNLSPDLVSAFTHKKVWWQCDKGHEWEASVNKRANGRNCPYCAGQRVCDDNSLQMLNPEISKQWHSTKNQGLTPNDVTVGSNKVVWWQCDKGHEWEASIVKRKITGCPYCSGKRVCIDNCLQTLNPELSKQWHPSKNADLTPSDVTTGSKKKVWWQCEKGHEWEATVANRGNGKGCPFCSGNRACNDNSLQTLNPALSNQWNLEKNGDLTPNDVTPGSNKKVWWLCEKGHEWEAIINRRNVGSGCPYCSGQYICIDNCLQTLNLKLSKQWHPSKNDNLTPKDVTSVSTKKVWWQCEKGHEWETSVNHRTNGTGCPFCSGRLACDDNSLQTLYPELSKQWHFSKNDDLTPSDVTPGSEKKTWWQCEKGHEWEAAINNRVKGSGCPVCYRTKTNR